MITLNNATALNDPARLAVLDSLGLLDSGTEPTLDRLTNLLATLTGAPIALITLVDTERQFFTSCFGLPEPLGSTRQTPLSHSFCQHTVMLHAPLVITDARDHPLVANNPAISDFGVIAYAGMPLILDDDQVIGTCCIIDQQPREWQPAELLVLEEITKLVQAEIEDHRQLVARQQVETLMLASEERLRTVVDNAPIGLFAIDASGTFTLVAGQCMSAFHTASERAVGESASAAFAEIPPLLDLIQHAFTGTAAAERLELEAGTFEVNCVPLYQDDGAVREIIGVVTDVTAHMSLEAQLLQAQKMESVGRLAGGIAHDFNNLLTAIMGYADLGRQTLPPDAAERQLFLQIRDVARRSAVLIRQLLTFARKQITAPQTVDINELLTSMTSLLQRLVREDIDIVTQLTDEIPLVHVDPYQMDQVLANLAVNARDAMPSGGVLVIKTETRIYPSETMHTTGPLPAGEYVLLHIADTGTGMDDHVRQHLFEPFFTTKGADHGTGLGLATCYGIITQHGGAIDVQSAVGRGTCFTIILPRTNGAATALTKEDLLEPLPCGTETILVVEDDSGVRELLVDVLTEQGYTVLAAEDGAEALSFAQSVDGRRIDMVITDVVMPRLGGRTLVDQLTGWDPDLRVLVISGYSDDVPALQAWLLDGIAFLPKPFAPATLARKVRSILDSG